MTYKYVPYTGGTGPTLAQADSNTEYLHDQLIRKSVDSTIRRLEDEITVILKDGAQITYDRWGFFSEKLNLDQANLEVTLNAIDISTGTWLHSVMPTSFILRQLREQTHEKPYCKYDH